MTPHPPAQRGSQRRDCARLADLCGYTLNSFRYLDNTASAGLAFSSIYTPRHILRLWTDYRLPGALNAWSVGGGVNFQSESARTTSNIKIAQPSYAVWTARVRYQVNRNWSLALNVNDLFDKTDYRTVGAPGWGNFYGGREMRR